MVEHRRAEIAAMAVPRSWPELLGDRGEGECTLTVDGPWLVAILEEGMTYGHTRSWRWQSGR